MRIIRMILIAIVVLVVIAVIGAVIFLKTLDVNRFKAQIVEEISRSLGRTVDLRHVQLDLSLRQGITLRVSGLRVADDPAFSSEPIFYIDSAFLNVDVLAFLTRRQVFVSKAELHSPKINIIRKADGRLNVQAFAEQAQKNLAGPKPSAGAPEAASEGSSDRGDDPKGSDAAPVGDMLVRFVGMSDGTVNYSDDGPGGPVRVSLDQIDFSVANFSLHSPFTFEGKMALVSAQQNARLNGTMQMDAIGQQARLDDVKIALDVSAMSLNRIYESLPSLKKNAVVKDWNDVEASIEINQALLGKAGLLALSSNGKITAKTLELSSLPVPIHDVQGRFDLTESDFGMEEFKMTLASGELTLTGRVVEYLKEQKFLIKGDLVGLQTGALAGPLGMPVQLQGKVFSNFEADGRGFTLDAIKKSLTAKGFLRMEEGRVADVNILRLALSKISFIPNLVETIEERLPEKYQERLRADDTVLEKVEVNVQVRDGALVIQPSELNAEGFLIVSRGSMDFEQNLELNADLYIPADVSAEMAAVVPDLGYFLDEAKRVHIPFKPYRGKAVNLRMYPDVEDIGKEILRNRGREELRNVIYKALDLQEGDPAADPAAGESQNIPADGAPQSTDTSTPDAQASPEKEIIENILQMIPVFQ